MSKSKWHKMVLTVAFNDPVTPMEARAAVRSLTKTAGGDGYYTAYHDWKTGVAFHICAVRPPNADQE